MREAVAQQAQGARVACALLPYGITGAVKRLGRMLGKNIFFRILSIIFRYRAFSTPCAVFSGEWGTGKRERGMVLPHARCAEDERSKSEGRFGEAEPRRGAQASAFAKYAKFFRSRFFL